MATGVTATANKSQPPRGYPQGKNSAQETENDGKSNEKLGNTEPKERGLGAFYSRAWQYGGGRPGHGYGHQPAPYPPAHTLYPHTDHPFEYEDAPGPFPPAYYAGPQGPPGHAVLVERYGEYSSPVPDNYGHGFGHRYGHGHGHGPKHGPEHYQYGHQMGPPFHPSDYEYDYYVHKYHG
ncbi:hypothetical protein O6H91_09G073000 [Diphasiastrum complanatum]|uniref:Uncharacterized protein n=1 Tax=Diphasiastrum complanatum TaxID=34168 RepID=A0ACC2CQK8_DIPCM|nr:hypothetical protein O6H91_09G073000 [Diphasiastrum complanatum]